MPWAVPTVALPNGINAISTQVAATPSAAVTLLAANPKRIKAIISYPDTSVLNVKLGVGASSTNFTYSFKGPDNLEITQWPGIITAIKVSGNSTLTVTEVT